ncbi:phage holin family protein [Citricoccus muralis]|uniref:Phage holin family protein n=1 Tax=Citricoccus muralis TaxID=169134 RepID=A0ABY8H9J1_9MICC|nr:phage holin family protein [Citricoccus muralis]WFP17576.1 phage holin family protein [Citricoccus muralis]
MANPGTHAAADASAQHSSQRGRVRVTDQTRSSSMLDLTATGLRLVPKQLKDESALAVNHIKSKGMGLGVGIGLAVLGLFLLAIVLIALVVALIGAFADTGNLWFWSLMVAAGALVISLIFIGIGALILKGQMPLVPQETIRGFKHDLGYLAEGNAFDPVEFDRLEAEKAERKKQEKLREKELTKQARKEEKAARKRGEAPTTVASIKPSSEELRHRAELRRRHLGDIRSGLEEKTDVKAQFAAFTAAATGRRREDAGTSPVSPYTGAVRAGEKVGDASDYVKDRWQPIALLGASSTALAVFLKKLTDKK